MPQRCAVVVRPAFAWSTQLSGGTDLLSGRVRCGVCQRLMTLDQNGQGKGSTAATNGAKAAPSPAGPTSGCCGPAVLGLRLIGDDIELQAAIRKELERARTPAPRAGGGPRTRRSRHRVEELVSRRRKLLRLYYADKIGADLFAEEKALL